MSIEMAEHMDFDHVGLQEVANAVRDNTAGNDDHSTTTTQKRKRGLADQDESADSTGRSNYKRVPRNSSANAGHGNQASNPSGNSMMNNQQDSDAGVEALQDFTSGNQNGGNDHANASSTAAAALAGIYPTMTIPQPTDVSFATQASDADRNDQSYNMDDSQANDSFMDNSVGGAHSSGGRGSTSGSKPAVGSEEWHKVRKDNHKEGKLSMYVLHCQILTLYSRTSPKGDYQRRHQ
jgi:transcriptional regulator CBF1